jgi:hypothetical protein
VTDAFEDFVVMLETADGTLYTYRPEAFRSAAKCSTAISLDECVRRYNVRMAREGIQEHARLVLRPKRHDDRR